MSLFLTLADLFFIGSVFGWVLELLFRKFFSGTNPEHRWINPGFCVGPYLPLAEHLKNAADALEQIHHRG